MNVCGVEISDGFTTWFVVAAFGGVLLFALTGLAVWADRRYQRTDYQRREALRRARWVEPRVPRLDEEPDDAA